MSKKKKQIPDELELAAYVNLHFRGIAGDHDRYELYQALHGAAYARICLGILMNCCITPDIIDMTANYYMMYQREPTAAVILIDGKMRIKEIVTISKGYRPLLTDFRTEIKDLCLSYKVKKCALIYNYVYKLDSIKELQNLNNVYGFLADSGITLVDAVRFADEKTESVMRRFNSAGYSK